LFAEVKSAYAEYAYVAEAKRVFEAQAEILRFIEQIAETRYGMGLTRQFEYLRIQIERSRAENRIVEFDQMRGAVSARLSRAVGRTSDPELPWPKEAVLPPHAPPGPVVLARVHQMNPGLAATEAAAEARDIGVGLAKKKGKPDFMLEFDYGWMKSPMGTRKGERALGAAMGTRDTFNAAAEANALDFAGSAFDAFSAITDRDRERSQDDASVSLSINLPIWRKKVRAGVAEARNMAEAARFERQSMQLDLESEAREALFRLQDAQRSHRLYDEDLLPKAQLALEGVQSAFGAGDFSVEVRDVLDGVNTLLDLQLERLGAGRDWRQAAAQLEMVMGGPWTLAGVAEEADDVREENETAPEP
ncbi:MAG: TolC family protein, partial [Candidatus Hydrogenedentota bacterium]